MLRNIDTAVRSSEENSNVQINKSREDFLIHLHEFTDKMTTDMNGLDKRLTISDRVLEDLLDRVKISASIVEAYLLSSPYTKKYDAVSKIHNYMNIIYEKKIKIKSKLKFNIVACSIVL